MRIAGPVRRRNGLPFDADSTIRRQWLCLAPGQEEPCAVDTIEGRIAEVLERKRQMFTKLIEQNEPPPCLGLTEEEIRREAEWVHRLKIQ